LGAAFVRAGNGAAEPHGQHERIEAKSDGQDEISRPDRDRPVEFDDKGAVAVGFHGLEPERVSDGAGDNRGDQPGQRQEPSPQLFAKQLAHHFDGDVAVGPLGHRQRQVGDDEHVVACDKGGRTWNRDLEQVAQRDVNDDLHHHERDSRSADKCRECDEVSDQAGDGLHHSRPEQWLVNAGEPGREHSGMPASGRMPTDFGVECTMIPPCAGTCQPPVRVAEVAGPIIILTLV